MIVKLSRRQQAVLCVALSSKLSMGYNTACQAAEMVQDELPDRLVEVLDSQQVTISQGFVAIAARAAVEGKSSQEVLQLVEEKASVKETYFAILHCEAYEEAREFGEQVKAILLACHF